MFFQFPGGWVCVRSRTPWASTVGSPVRLGVSPTFPIPTEFYSQRFWVFSFPCWNHRIRGVSCSLVVPPGLFACEHGTPRSARPCLACEVCYLATHPLCSGCLSPSIQLIWMNVSSLTSWLSEFLVVWFSGSSGCFLFLNWLLSFFWLCEEAKHFYLCFHLDWNCSTSKFYTCQLVHSSKWLYVVHYYYYIHSKCTDIEAEKSPGTCSRSTIGNYLRQNYKHRQASRAKIFNCYIISKLKCTEMVNLIKIILKSVYTKNIFLISFIYFYREEGKERGRETSMCGCV